MVVFTNGCCAAHASSDRDWKGHFYYMHADFAAHPIIIIKIEKIMHASINTLSLLILNSSEAGS